MDVPGPVPGAEGTEGVAVTPRDDRTAQITAALLGVAVDGVVPHGTDSRVAKELGRTRERVRQVRKSLGLYRTRLPRYGCAECGRPFSGRVQRKARMGLPINPLCGSCRRYIPVACDTCGKITMRDARHLIFTTNNIPRYTTGSQFCSRQCFGKWAGTHGGWGSPAHPIHHMQKRAHVPRHGTHSEYSNYGCRCPECKAAQHAHYLSNKRSRRARKRERLGRTEAVQP